MPVLPTDKQAWFMEDERPLLQPRIFGMLCMPRAAGFVLCLLGLMQTNGCFEDRRTNVENG